MKNVILTVASGGVFAKPEALALPYSWRARGEPEKNDLVVLCGDAPEEYVRHLKRAGAKAVRVSCSFTDPGNKHRHWYLGQWLHEHGREYGLAMTVDARDTFVQGDPFSLPDGSAFPGVVRMSAESGKVGEDPWNAKDAAAFAKALRRPCVHAFEGFRVVNGGFVMAPARDLANFSLLRFALDAREGPGTDQASLTAFAHWAKGLPDYAVVGVDRAWVYHAHWAERAGDVEFVGGLACLPGGPAFRVLHQWDRVKAVKEAVLREVKEAAD